VNALIINLGRLAIRYSHVFQPMSARYRSRKVVRCPEFDEPAEILVDRSRRAALDPKKRTFSIRDCSLWPKGKGCTQSCEK
jgi:hypothetical protein